MFHISIMQNDPTLPPDLRPRGRGAGSNAAGRFEAHSVSYAADDPDPDAEARVLRTTVSEERAGRVITYNRSPDLPFDRSINPYRGCEHGCIYCFARPSHAWLGLSAGLDFETRLIARPDAPARLEAELRARSYKVAPIAIGTNTDPYQPIERQYGITRACLEVLERFNHPVAVVTKGALIERDIDLLAGMAARGLARVGVSITTLDATLARKLEPRAPAPERRLATIRRLAEAGVPVRLMVSPVIPALTDAEIETICEAGCEAGAEAVSWIMLRLPREVLGLFRDWLAQHYPDRAGRVMNRLREMHDGRDYAADWHQRMRGQGVHARMIARRFELVARRLRLDAPQPALRCDVFEVPLARGAQLALF
ncbi:DNA repair photolyase [Roseovarius sp. MBR-78]